MKAKTRIGYAKPVNAESVKIVEIGENEVSTEVDKSGSRVDTNNIIGRMGVGEISKDQKQRIKALNNRHQGVFSLDEYDVGLCQGIEHRINLTYDKPLTVPYRRIPPQQWDEVREY